MITITDNLFSEEEMGLIKNHGAFLYQDIELLQSWKGHPLTNYAETDVGHSFTLNKKFPDDKEIMEIVIDKLKLSYPKIRIIYYWNNPGWRFALHPDVNRSFAASIYLNEDWDNKKYGGQFIWLDGKMHRNTVDIKYNRAISFYPPVWHCTKMIRDGAPVRESIQVFCED